MEGLFPSKASAEADLPPASATSERAATLKAGPVQIDVMQAFIIESLEQAGVARQAPVTFATGLGNLGLGSLKLRVTSG